MVCAASVDSIGISSMADVFREKDQMARRGTNRVTEFDDAVHSRRHIGIAYKPLGLDTRKGIWESFLKKPTAGGKVVSFSGTDLQDLAERELNGRQVSCLL